MTMRRPAMRPLWPLRAACSCLLLLISFGCTPAWKEHQQSLAKLEDAGNWDAAEEEAQWLIDNAFVQAPPSERSEQAEADRYLRLADIAMRTGNFERAIEAMRQALTLDPTCAPSVQKKLNRLPLTPEQKKRVAAEFAWNMMAIAPDAGGLLGPQKGEECWSYHVREIRVRHDRIIKTRSGKTRQVTYDARSWSFDARSGAWHPESDWMPDLGAESEPVEGPQSPRYQAVVDADHGFYADGRVPPCHRHGWHGPYDRDQTVFTATHLPSAAPHD